MRADGHLFLRPTHVTEDWRATQPMELWNRERKLKHWDDEPVEDMKT